MMNYFSLWNNCALVKFTVKYRIKLHKIDRQNIKCNNMINYQIYVCFRLYFMISAIAIDFINSMTQTSLLLVNAYSNMYRIANKNYLHNIYNISPLFYYLQY